MLYICISLSKSAPHSTDMFKMHSQCIIFCPLSSSLSSSCLLNQARMPCHFVICQSRSAFTAMNVTFQVSMKASPQPKQCVCVVGGGADLSEVMADTQAALQWSDQSPMVTLT